jgi:hypothetical protein
MVVLALMAVACGRPVFGCRDDTQCVTPDGAGVCEVSGFCSFPDPSCASGRRYGKHAGDGLANTCTTPEHDGTSGGSAAGTVASEVTSTGGSSASSVSGETDPDGCTEASSGDDCEPDCEADCESSGTVLWVRTFDGGLGLDDAIRDVVGLPDGRIAAVGNGRPRGSTGNRVEIRLHDADGDPVWVERPADIGNGVGWGVEPSGDSSIVVSAELYSGHMWVTRLGLDKTSAWSTLDDGAGFDVVADDSGRTWVSGRVEGQLALWELDGQGAIVDVIAGAPLPTGSSVAWDLAQGPDGTLVLVGNDGTGHAWVGAYDPAQGAIAWTKPNPQPEATASEVYGVALTPRGDVVTCGYSSVDGQAAGWIASGAQNLAWARRGESLGSPLNIHQVAVAASGEIAASGWIQGDDSQDIWIAKLTPDGDLVWAHVFAGAEGQADYGWSVTIDAQQRVVAGGAIATEDHGTDVWLAAFAL